MSAPSDVMELLGELPELVVLATTDPASDRLIGIAPKIRAALTALIFERDALRAELEAARKKQVASVVVPDGWQLVPYRPTHGMAAVSSKAVSDARDECKSAEEIAYFAYYAMLAAAPKPEASV